MSEVSESFVSFLGHPLTFLVENHDNYPKDGVVCGTCSERILSGPLYTFEEHYGKWYWHKVCAELPREIKHPIHPEHSLIRFKDLLNAVYGKPHFICDACGKASKGLTGYQCSPCEFRLDMNCALMAHKIDLDCHPHPLVPLQEPALFRCACGDKHEGLSYKCTFCSFWVHQNCASQPSTIEHRYHDHCLTLARTPPEEYSKFDTNCDICYGKVDWEYWAYYCGGCRYFAHLKCVTSKKIPLDQTNGVEDVLDPNVVFFSLPNDSVSIITQFVNKDSLEDIKVVTELDHFGHDHPLALFDGHINDEVCSGSKENLPLLNVENGSKLCEACVQPIVAPFYGCTECNYLLHKCCAELPTQIQNPYKPEHLLDLLPKDTKSVALFPCLCCGKPTNGFVYKCAQFDECCFDVKCGSLLSGPIKHEAHKHLLFPGVTMSSENCSACSQEKEGHAFECGTCNFSMDTYCALLPKALNHRYDEHPFILNYSPVIDHPSEYYCELCEEEVNPKFWFYHCDVCDQSIHTLCALLATQKSNMGYGTSYKLEFHPHPLTFVEFSREYYDRCSHCRKPLRGYFSPGFECESCNLKLHFECTELGKDLKWL